VSDTEIELFLAEVGLFGKRLIGQLQEFVGVRFQGLEREGTE
jgi:hypothetical protein